MLLARASRPPPALLPPPPIGLGSAGAPKACVANPLHRAPAARRVHVDSTTIMMWIFHQYTTYYTYDTAKYTGKPRALKLCSGIPYLLQTAVVYNFETYGTCSRNCSSTQGAARRGTARTQTIKCNREPWTSRFVQRTYRTYLIRTSADFHFFILV